MDKPKLVLLEVATITALTSPVAFAEEQVDLDAVHRIKAEAFEHSEVMEHLFYLGDMYGPRLANSSGFLPQRTGSSGDWERGAFRRI